MFHRVSMMRNWILALALLVSCMANAEQKFHQTETETAVVYLLNYVAGSDSIFIRNGKEYNGAQASSHLKDKYEHFKNDIQTPEDFIRLAATKSMISGKPYLVRLKGGTVVPCNDWLKGALKAYREKHP